MDCPKCKHDTILKRLAVPRSETHVKRVVKGVFREVRVSEPKFYTCTKCFHKFNVE